MDTSGKVFENPGNAVGNLTRFNKSLTASCYGNWQHRWGTWLIHSELSLHDNILWGGGVGGWGGEGAVTHQVTLFIRIASAVWDS